MKLFEGYETPVDAVEELDFKVRWPLDEDGHTVEINQPEQLVFEGLSGDTETAVEPLIVPDKPYSETVNSILLAVEYRCGRLPA